MSIDVRNLLGRRAGKVFAALFVAALAAYSPQLAFANDEPAGDRATAEALAEGADDPDTQGSENAAGDEVAENGDQTYGSNSEAADSTDSENEGANGADSESSEVGNPETDAGLTETESTEDAAGDTESATGDADSTLIAIDFDAVANSALDSGEASVKQAEPAEAKQSEPDAAFAKTADEPVIDVEHADADPSPTPATPTSNASLATSAPAIVPIAEAAVEYPLASEPTLETIATPSPQAKRSLDGQPAPVGYPVAPSESEISRQLTQAPGASKLFAVEPGSSPPATSKHACTAVDRSNDHAPSRANGPTRCRSPSRD